MHQTNRAEDMRAIKDQSMVTLRKMVCDRFQTLLATLVQVRTSGNRCPVFHRLSQLFTPLRAVWVVTQAQDNNEPMLRSTLGGTWRCVSVNGAWSASESHHSGVSPSLTDDNSAVVGVASDLVYITDNSKRLSNSLTCHSLHWWPWPTQLITSQMH